MSTTVEAMVEGGKATAGPPIGPALGPLGVNIGEVINSINQKTQAFKGMKVPVKIIVQQDKSFNIEVGTPPVSQLITKELGIEKGSGTPNSLKVGNMAVEQVIKVAAMKKESNNLFPFAYPKTNIIKTKNKIEIVIFFPNKLSCFCKGVSFSYSSSTPFAIFPNSVLNPIFIITALPLPLIAIVPEKTIFF